MPLYLILIEAFTFNYKMVRFKQNKQQLLIANVSMY